MGLEPTNAMRDEARRGLDWAKQHGAPPQLVACGERLAAGEPIDERLFKVMAVAFHNQANMPRDPGYFPDEPGYPNPDRIRNALLGGRFASRMIGDQMREHAKGAAGSLMKRWSQELFEDMLAEVFPDVAISQQDHGSSYVPSGRREKPEGATETVIINATFRKALEEKHLVYAEVYLPDIEDAHGHQMTREEIEEMAHGFLKNARTTQIDLNHDNKTGYGCYMVESFIARDGDPDYAPGAWVAAVKVENPEVWKMIKSGEITGFSFEGMGYVVEESGPNAA